MVKSGIQVSKEHYYNNYDDINRFISYFYQVDLAKRLKPKRILEIGVGNKTVSNYLKQQGFKVTTCDFDENLEPDYTADLRKLPFENNSYDVVLAYEILEHLPWEDVDTALKELHRVSKKYVIISIPYLLGSFEFVFQFPLINKILKKAFIDVFFGMPLFFINTTFLKKRQKEHHWEMGIKDYSSRKIRKIFRKKFKIIQEVRPLLNSYHHFFILEKK